MSGRSHVGQNICGAGVSGLDVTCAVRLVRLAGRSGRFVVGSIGRLAEFSFGTKPVIKVRSGFAATSFVQLIGATANRIIGDCGQRTLSILSTGRSNGVRSSASFVGHR